MKHHTLTRFFFLNYLCLLVFLLAGVWVANSYSTAKVDDVLSWVDDDQIMNAYETYEQEGAKPYFDTILNDLKFSVEYFVLLSPEGKVLDGYGSMYPKGYQFPEKESNRLINDPDTYAFYPYETDEIAVIKLTGDQMKNRIQLIMIRTWGTYSLAVVLVLFLLTRTTASRVVRPIESLTDAVQQVGDGRYDIHADFEASYEVGQLKNALMAMSLKIQEENRLRTESEADRRQLVLNISHDLKTPLTNIRGYAEAALARCGDADETLGNHLTIILNNSIKADTLLRNLFELSRIENAAFVPDLVSQDIGEVIRRLLTAYVPELEASGIEFDFDIPSAPLMVDIDEALIRRALSNLLDNSLRHLAGAKEPLIRIAVTHEGRRLIRITVSDNGPGIPEELWDQVFKPFVTADQARNRVGHGTGLGLAITRAIIEKHRGTVAIADLSSPGVSFVVHLPVQAGERLPLAYSS